MGCIAGAEVAPTGSKRGCVLFVQFLWHSGQIHSGTGTEVAGGLFKSLPRMSAEHSRGKPDSGNEANNLAARLALSSLGGEMSPAWHYMNCEALQARQT